MYKLTTSFPELGMTVRELAEKLLPLIDRSSAMARTSSEQALAAAGLPVSPKTIRAAGAALAALGMTPSLYYEGGKMRRAWLPLSATLQVPSPPTANDHLLGVPIGYGGFALGGTPPPEEIEAARGWLVSATRRLRRVSPRYSSRLLAEFASEYAGIHVAGGAILAGAIAENIEVERVGELGFLACRVLQHGRVRRA